MAEISVVVPVFGCRGCLEPLHRRLVSVVSELSSDYELIFVDDRSTDGSWPELLELSAADPAVKLVRLSRNFGQHPAITAGLAEATGEWVVVTDCDLEDPPEEVLRLWSKAQEGYDFVLSRRRRRRQAIWRRAGARIYRWLANALAGTDIDPQYTNLSLLSRPVVDAFLRFRDQDRQYLLMLLWLGFRHETIDVDQDERYAGHSAYSFRQLVRVAADGVFFQTTKLLRWIVYAGFIVGTAGIVLAVLAVVNWIERDPPTGYTSLAVVILILSGMIIASTGVMGLYVGKVFAQVKGRPLYVVDEVIEGGVERPHAAVPKGAEVGVEAGAAPRSEISPAPPR
ncbi:MAG: polyisoprenyl-phosphate glycosyltransferase [Solirubrobacterales bacterium]|jgi:dolichol-phosphate mannosyltransferase|nr:polyisoprenyl-phosphate glycosyltransferase [Solirubrobacterales bacterium]